MSKTAPFISTDCIISPFPPMVGHDPDTILLPRAPRGDDCRGRPTQTRCFVGSVERRTPGDDGGGPVFPGPWLIRISNRALAGPGVVRRGKSSHISMNSMRGRCGGGKTHATTNMNLTTCNCNNNSNNNHSKQQQHMYVNNSALISNLSYTVMIIVTTH